MSIVDGPGHQLSILVSLVFELLPEDVILCDHLSDLVMELDEHPVVVLDLTLHLVHMVLIGRQ